MAEGDAVTTLDYIALAGLIAVLVFAVAMTFQKQ